MVPKKRKLCFSNSSLSLFGGSGWVTDQKGMFSFAREEKDRKLGGKNSPELDKNGRSRALSAQPKYRISVAEDHAFLDLIQKIK